jgi:hypothetical protein
MRRYADLGISAEPATLIYRRPGNRRAAQLLLGHSKIESRALP